MAKTETPPRNVAIIHYNTPELTEAAIKSLWKHGGKNYKVFVFDNSDRRPFKRRMRGVTIIDNTHGQVIDFEEFLMMFPERNPRIGCQKGCEFGSAKHMRTVQELWGLIPEGFLLMESDILLRDSVEHMFRYDRAVCGHVVRQQSSNPYYIGRIMPMLCFMNVPKLVGAGALYFDPNRTYGLHARWYDKSNWYDTGAVLLEDVRRMKPTLVGRHIDIRPLIEHYGSGSWRNNDPESHRKWLNEHKELWK